MKTFIKILIAFSLYYCNGQKLQPITDYDDYIPSSIKHISNNGVYKDFKGDIIIIDSLKLSDFNFITTTVTVLDENQKIGGFGITFEKMNYKIVYSFENYIEAYDSLGNMCRLGASIEVIANIKTRKQNLNLSDLFSLAVTADRNKIKGSLSMSAKGFNSNNIYGLFNINSSIDKASVQQALKNVGIMISKFSDKNIMLKPVILGYKPRKDSE